MIKTNRFYLVILTNFQDLFQNLANCYLNHSQARHCVDREKQTRVNI